MSDEMTDADLLARIVVDRGYRGDALTLARALLAGREEIEQWKQRWSDACELARTKSVECEEMRQVYEAATQWRSARGDGCAELLLLAAIDAPREAK